MMNEIYVHKCISVDDVVLANIICDGLMSFGYTEASARAASEKLMNIPDYIEYNVFTGVKITKKRLLNAIRNYIARNDDNDIMLISDNARDVLMSISA